jgi:WXG100 family type VII secretion target
MTVSLSPDQATAKIAAIDAARNQANQAMARIQNEQEGMGTTWQGGSATKYNTTSQQQHDDFTQIMNTLNSIVETGSAHIRSIANMDNG